MYPDTLRSWYLAKHLNSRKDGATNNQGKTSWAVNATTTKILSKGRMWQFRGKKKKAIISHGWVKSNKWGQRDRQESYYTDQGFSDFNVPTNYMGMDLVKMQILIKQVWGRVWNSAFPTCFQEMPTSAVDLRSKDVEPFAMFKWEMIVVWNSLVVIEMRK